MAALMPEYSRFDPHADYAAMVAAFRIEFATAKHKGTIFDAGEGIRVLAGNMAAVASLSYLAGAETLRLIAIETKSEEHTTYWYNLQHVRPDGELLGRPYTGRYTSAFGDADLAGHTQDEGERIRGWCDAVSFDRFEAALVAPEQVSTELMRAVYDEEATVNAAKIAVRRARAAHRLRWLGPLNPLRPRTQRRQQ